MLFDAPRREITSLAISPSGTIYAANVGDKSRNNLPPLPVQGVANVTTTITIVQPGSIQTFNGNTIIPDGTEVFEIPATGAPHSLWASRDELCTRCAPRRAGCWRPAGIAGAYTGLIR